MGDPWTDELKMRTAEMFSAFDLVLLAGRDWLKEIEAHPECYPEDIRDAVPAFRENLNILALEIEFMRRGKETKDG